MKSSAMFSIYISFAIWVVVLLLVGLSVGGLLKRVAGGRWVRPFFYPAVVVRLLSQTAVCMLTFAKIRGVRVLDGEEAEVEHDRSKLWLVGETLIALAPIVGCGLALAGVGAWLGFDMEFDFKLPRDFDHGFAAFGSELLEIAQKSAENIWTEYLRSWEGFVFLYFCLAFTTFMAPARKEVAMATVGVALFCAGVWVYDALVEGPWWGLFDYGKELIKRGLWGPIGFFVSLQVFLLAFVLCVAGLAKLAGLYGLKRSAR